MSDETCNPDGNSGSSRGGSKREQCGAFCFILIISVSVIVIIFFYNVIIIIIIIVVGNTHKKNALPVIKDHLVIEW